MSKLLKAAVKGAATEYWQEVKTYARETVEEVREWASQYTQEGEAEAAEVPETATEFRYVYREGHSAWWPVSVASKVKPVYIVHRVEFR